jgi:rhamnogalacturonyl hydrolase YesR
MNRFPARLSLVIALASYLHPGQAKAEAPQPVAIVQIMEQVADWQLAHPPNYPSTNWRAAAGFTGMMALANLSAKPDYYEAMRQMGEGNDWQPGPHKYSADDQCVGQIYAELYAQDPQPQMIAPLRACFDEILAHPAPATLDYTTPKGRENWSWCDSLFMAPPAWIQLWSVTGDRRYLDFAVNKWWVTSDYLYDKDEHLFFRDLTYFGKKEANGKKVFWSRGNGWVMAGLVRMLEYLPAEHPQRARFVQQFREMAQRIITLQQPDGMWRASLLDPASFPLRETSGTGFFCYALAWGVNAGLLDRATFAPPAVKAWQALVACVEPDGKLTHVQPVGADPRHFDEQSTDAFGVGAFLLAGSEMFRLEGGKAEKRAATPLAIFASLKPGHPRLIAAPQTWPMLKSQRKHDPALEAFLMALEKQGRALLGTKPVTYQKQGRRLLAVSRTVLSRVLLWSFDFRITGDRAFLQRAQQEMLTVADFPDWNPSHFLDTAEMTAALAFGYDWLYDELDARTRAKIEQAIAEKGLRQLTQPKVPSEVGWQQRDNNWNQVCFGGLTLGALAIADQEPALAAQVLQFARLKNIHGLKPYAPDGIYPEGPSYWSYGTTYEVLMVAALHSALGTDWQLSAQPGFLESARVLLQTTGPTGRAFNYSDGTEKTDLQPALFWMAQQLNDPSVLAFQFAQLHVWLAQEVGDASGAETARFLPLTALWWANPAEAALPKLPLSWTGRGEQPLAIFRSAWGDPNAMYLAVKGGSASLSHAHMDAGSFIFEADGVRWARDLGMQQYYSLESKGINLWDGKQTGDRWKVFRLNNHSHNVLTIDDQLFNAAGAAQITKFSEQKDASIAVLDLSPVYAGQAKKVTRGFVFRPGKQVLIRDELEGLKPGSAVRWAMVTDAKITFNGEAATLSESGKTLHVQLLAPASAQLASISAEPPKDAFDAPNPGQQILIVNAVAPASGALEICVQLTPGAVAETADPLASTPLEKWPASPIKKP